MRGWGRLEEASRINWKLSFFREMSVSLWVLFPYSPGRFEQLSKTDTSYT